jgi:hypothetical protein
MVRRLTELNYALSQGVKQRSCLYGTCTQPEIPRRKKKPVSVFSQEVCALRARQRAL